MPSHEPRVARGELSHRKDDSQQREDLQAGDEYDHKNAHAAGHGGERPNLLGAKTRWDFADMQRDNFPSEGFEDADQHQRSHHYYQDFGDVVTKENHGVFAPVTQQCGKIPVFRHGQMQQHTIHIQGAIIASGQGAIRLRANV